MIRDFTLHGEIGERIEYYAMVAGPNLARELYSFEIGGPDDPFAARFFSQGNEITLEADGVVFRGTGGSLCEYMFGVDLPFEDLTRHDVSNRLTVHGALEDRAERALKFTARTSGRESYDSLFLNGNAVTDYFFFVAPGDRELSVLDFQRELLRVAGKRLKRFPLNRADSLRELTYALMDALVDFRPTVFVTQLNHTVHRRYYEECRRAFADHQDIAGEVEVQLVARAQELGIDQYTRERIKIDTVYKEPENKLLIDEYKKLLVEASALDVVPPEVVARLARLRTLSLRRRIPEVILKKLDYKFPIAVARQAASPSGSYLDDVRTVLEGLFVSNAPATLEGDDAELLIRAKHKAALTRDSSFEELLLETGRRIDEAAERGESGHAAVEQFSNIVTYFDRYDACNEMINRLAFIGESALTSDRVRSLRGHQEAFSHIRAGLFEECFFEPLAQNKYLSAHGKKKTAALRGGLEELVHGEVSYSEVAARIQAAATEEKHYNLLATYFRNNLKQAYLYKAGEPVAALHERVNSDLFVRGLIKEMIPMEIFHTVLQHVLEEDLYLTEVLPQVVDRGDEALRGDFIQNSGLDLFRIEELEKEFLERRRLPLETLSPIETLPLREFRPQTA